MTDYSERTRRQQARDFAGARAACLTDPDRINGKAGASPTAEGGVVPWPAPLADEAYYGLAGEVVRAIEPHTEADSAALLVQFLASFGNVIGRTAHSITDGVQHFLILFVVLVGMSSRSRKGTSWAHNLNLYSVIDLVWATERVQSGLSSGEGLIHAVRDPGRVPKQGGGFQADPGVADKRLLVQEPEFAAVLHVCQRQANTLSTTIRQAWDGGILRTLTKNSPTKATGAHISIAAHVTKDELRRQLTETDQANGFANRFLWVCVKRSKLLPDGGSFQVEDLGDTLCSLQEAVAAAQGVGEMKRDEEARALWHDVYARLSSDRFGLFGAVTARAEAQTVRLACLYALLDSSAVVRVEHLRAALAVWRYCEDSAKFIFGDSLGDPTADQILQALRRSADGMCRTAISELFKRNRPASEIDRALGILAEHGLVRTQGQDTGGRPIEMWYALEAGQAQGRGGA